MPRSSGRADHYPLLTGLLAGADEPETAELRRSRFELGLALVLDGVERFLSAQPGPVEASTEGGRPG